VETLNVGVLAKLKAISPEPVEVLISLGLAALLVHAAAVIFRRAEL
jgi:hypothetical protein